MWHFLPSPGWQHSTAREAGQASSRHLLSTYYVPGRLCTLAQSQTGVATSCLVLGGCPGSSIWGYQGGHQDFNLS